MMWQTKHYDTRTRGITHHNDMTYCQSRMMVVTIVKFDIIGGSNRSKFLIGTKIKN